MDTPRNQQDIDLLAELVSIDTTSALSNRPAIDLVCSRLGGADIELIRMPVHDGKENLVAIAGELDGSRRGLVLAGHLTASPQVRDGLHPRTCSRNERGGFMLVVHAT